MKDLTTEDTESTEAATPETDAKASPHIGFYSCATVPAEFARKLERERNELLAYLDAAHYATCNAELRRKRDEAQYFFEEQSEVVRNLKVALMEVSKLTRTLKEERDEARREVDRYREEKDLSPMSWDT